VGFAIGVPKELMYSLAHRAALQAVQIRNATYPIASIGQLVGTLGALSDAP
jgi:hypothetical protein